MAELGSSQQEFQLGSQDALAFKQAPLALAELATHNDVSPARFFGQNTDEWRDLVDISEGLHMAIETQKVLEALSMVGVTREEEAQHHADVIAGLDLPAGIHLHEAAQHYVELVVLNTSVIDEARQLLNPEHEEGKALIAHDQTNGTNLAQDLETTVTTLAQQILDKEARRQGVASRKVVDVGDAIAIGKAQILADGANLLAWNEKINAYEVEREKPISQEEQAQALGALKRFVALGNSTTDVLSAYDHETEVRDLQIQAPSQLILDDLTKAAKLFKSDEFSIIQRERDDARTTVADHLKDLQGVDLHPQVQAYIEAMIWLVALGREAKQYIKEGPEHQILVDAQYDLAKLERRIKFYTAHIVADGEWDKASSGRVDIEDIDEAMGRVEADVLAKPENLLVWNEALRRQEMKQLVIGLSQPFKEEVDLINRYEIEHASGVGLWNDIGVYGIRRQKNKSQLQSDIQIGGTFTPESSQATIEQFVRRLLGSQLDFASLAKIQNDLENIRLDVTPSEHHQAIMSILTRLYYQADSTIQEELKETMAKLDLADKNGDRLDKMDAVLKAKEAKQAKAAESPRR